MNGPVPAAIGRYAIESVLGRGAMGVIFKAHDPIIDRNVAIKLVNANLLDGEDRAMFIARFRQEAQAAGRCTHPNIVGIYDYALHEGNPYLAMEFIDGITLSQLNRDRELSLHEVVELTSQVLDALQAAHRLGVVHRDIKPANVMITRAGWVKVTDFGISRIEQSNITLSGSVVGTPSYMSPEQCRGDPVDPRSDLFSTGVVLFELVTGRKPFEGRTPAELWHRLLSEPHPDPAQLRPGLPPALGAVIARSLSKHPADRFPTASAMAAALRSSLAAGSDATTVMPRGPIGIQLDEQTFGTLERCLSPHVGAIAGQLIRDAARSAGNMDTLCRTLASSIGSAAGQQSFAASTVALRSSTVTGTGMMPAGYAPGELDALQAELARFIGPVARVLLKRAAAKGGTVAELRQRLADAIDKPADRAAFLAGRVKR